MNFQREGTLMENYQKFASKITKHEEQQSVTNPKTKNKIKLSNAKSKDSPTQITKKSYKQVLYKN